MKILMATVVVCACFISSIITADADNSTSVQVESSSASNDEKGVSPSSVGAGVSSSSDETDVSRSSGRTGVSLSSVGTGVSPSNGKQKTEKPNPGKSGSGCLAVSVTFVVITATVVIFFNFP